MPRATARTSEISCGEAESLPRKRRGASSQISGNERLGGNDQAPVVNLSSGGTVARSDALWPYCDTCLSPPVTPHIPTLPQFLNVGFPVRLPRKIPLFAGHLFGR